MRGIRITTMSGKLTLCMCHKCFNTEMDEINLAIEYRLIKKPEVRNIDKCEMHCKETYDEHRE